MIFISAFWLANFVYFLTIGSFWWITQNTGGKVKIKTKNGENKKGDV
jgi:hypothetical protein